MVDLDNFKQVNDIYGYEQGDRVLCYIAEQMMESFRKSDTVCRLAATSSRFLWRTVRMWLPSSARSPP